MKPSEYGAKPLKTRNIGRPGLREQLLSSESAESGLTMASDLIDLEGVGAGAARESKGSREPQRSASKGSLGPEPEILNKNVIQEIDAPQRPQLRSIDDTDFSDPRYHDDVEMKLSKTNLLRATYGLAGCFVLAAVIALAIAPDVSVDARPLGSIVYAALTLQLSLRASRLPRVDLGCCGGHGPSVHPQFWYAFMLGYFFTAATAGWVVSAYGSHAIAFGIGVFLAAFGDMVLLGAEEKRIKMGYTMVVVIILMILNLYVLYEESHVRSTGFDVMSGIVLLIHCPMQIAHITGRWRTGTSTQQPDISLADPAATEDGLPIRRISMANIDNDHDEDADDVVLISHD